MSLDVLKQQVEQLDRVNKQLLEGLKKLVAHAQKTNARLDELEQAKDENKKTRHAVSLATHTALMALLAEGKTVSEAAKMLDLHYNTALSYSKWDKKRIEEQRKKEEKQTVRTGVKTKEADTPTPEPVPAAPDVEPAVGASPADSGSEAEPAGTVMEAYGWIPWTAEDRTMADSYKLYIPTENLDDIIVVEYEHKSYSLPGTAQTFKWGNSDRNITAWRPATQAEVEQYFPA